MFTPSLFFFARRKITGCFFSLVSSLNVLRALSGLETLKKKKNLFHWRISFLTSAQGYFFWPHTKKENPNPLAAKAIDTANLLPVWTLSTPWVTSLAHNGSLSSPSVAALSAFGPRSKCWRLISFDSVTSLGMASWKKAGCLLLRAVDSAALNYPGKRARKKSIRTWCDDVIG